MGPEMKSAIDKFVASNKIVVFMKGNKEQPRCGFSNTVVQVFKSMEVPFETVDILEDEGLRAGMKVYSDWPTFPRCTSAASSTGAATSSSTPTRTAR